MGTNYYVTESATDKCGTCGHISGGDELHIGKSSGGWVFLLNCYPDKEITTFADWIVFMADRRSWITDEYGDPVEFNEMIKIIAERKPCGSCEELSRASCGSDGEYYWREGDGTFDISRKYQDFS